MKIKSIVRYMGAAVLLAACASVPARQVEVHDPVMAYENGHYYVFSTGPGITMYRSEDLQHWSFVDRVLDKEPDWAQAVAPGFNGHYWAPDVYEKNGRFYLYYSVSAFGKNTSGIGVASTPTLDVNAADYGWQDHGLVLQSVPNRDHWNAIDAAIVEDDQGNVWMSFGSFWEGLKLVKLDDSMIRLAEPPEWHSIARRPGDPTTASADPGAGAIEAPYIFRKGDWYYLFVSFDKCCRGMDSDYNVRVGRSQMVTGPYIDRAGVSLMDGGGTLVIEGNDRWVALGHNAAYTFEGNDFLVLHAYETADNAKQKLKILPMTWDDGWPVVDAADLDEQTTVLAGDGPPEND